MSAVDPAPKSPVVEPAPLESRDGTKTKGAKGETWECCMTKENYAIFLHILSTSEKLQEIIEWNLDPAQGFKIQTKDLSNSVLMDVCLSWAEFFTSYRCPRFVDVKLSLKLMMDALKKMKAEEITISGEYDSDFITIQGENSDPSDPEWKLDYKMMDFQSDALLIPERDYGFQSRFKVKDMKTILERFKSIKSDEFVSMTHIDAQKVSLVLTATTDHTTLVLCIPQKSNDGSAEGVFDLLQPCDLWLQTRASIKFLEFVFNSPPTKEVTWMLHPNEPFRFQYDLLGPEKHSKMVVYVAPKEETESTTPTEDIVKQKCQDLYGSIVNSNRKKQPKRKQPEPTATAAAKQRKKKKTTGGGSDDDETEPKDKDEE